MPYVARPLHERFWLKIPSRPILPCWRWSSYKDKDGYGKIVRDGGANGDVGAHRVSWEIHFGDIPEGLYVCHKCDNPECCNPTHLFLGTALDNSRDRERKGRGRNQHGLRKAQR